MFKDHDFEIEENNEAFIMNNAVTSHYDNNKDENESSDDEFAAISKQMKKDFHESRTKNIKDQIQIDQNAEINLSKLPETQSIGSNLKKAKKMKKLVRDKSKEVEKNRIIKDKLSNPNADKKSKPAEIKLTKKDKIMQEHMKQRKESIRKVGPVKKKH